MAVTKSEALVEQLARRSFLSLWSHANPHASRGDELCDFLVVCDPDVVIFSVKEIGLKRLEDGSVDETGWKRWHKKAVEESAKQIYGAERKLSFLNRVLRADGTEGFELPPSGRRLVHRVAVALGSNGDVPIEYGDFGKGFIHVLDEESLEQVMRELDTVSDFVRYLSAKEKLIKDGTYPLATEENLLAVYLHRGRSFPPHTGPLAFDPNAWFDLTRKPEWLARKQEDRISYLWDEIIERISRDLTTDGSKSRSDLDDLERAMRVMAREDRFSRRVLSVGLFEFMTLARAGESRSRMLASPSGVHYVFLGFNSGQDPELREYRRAQLAARCWVVRDSMTTGDTVVGLATEQDTSNGHSFDVVSLYAPEWTEEHARRAAEARELFGIFVNPRLSRLKADEYPTVPE